MLLGQASINLTANIASALLGLVTAAIGAAIGFRPRRSRVA